MNKECCEPRKCLRICYKYPSRKDRVTNEEMEQYGMVRWNDHCLKGTRWLCIKNRNHPENSIIDIVAIIIIIII